MKIDTRANKIEDGVLYKAAIIEAKEHFSKITGNISYMIKFKISVSETVNIIAEKYFQNDFEPDSELYQNLEKLGAIDEEGMYDKELLIDKEVQVTLETSTYNGRKQRRVNDILLQ